MSISMDAMTTSIKSSPPSEEQETALGVGQVQPSTGATLPHAPQVSLHTSCSNFSSLALRSNSSNAKSRFLTLAPIASLSKLRPFSVWHGRQYSSPQSYAPSNSRNKSGIEASCVGNDRGFLLTPSIHVLMLSSSNESASSKLPPSQICVLLTVEDSHASTANPDVVRPWQDFTEDTSESIPKISEKINDNLVLTQSTRLDPRCSARTSAHASATTSVS
mmetsp:Transcript_28328/g.59039  ORF Transcript_28328/g.59039 Transcript_28328/m.59039 type:complete len:219 (+) Transcript_28328:648-1304(+)